MGSRRRQKLAGSLHVLERQNPRNYLDVDPDDLMVKETPHAGKGLFARRFFEKGEFVCNYRGERKQTLDIDSIYIFDCGKPDFIKIDATDQLHCIGRYINDIDPFHLPNCYPRKDYDDKGDVIISFYCSKNVTEGDEFRYAYNSSFAPWRKKRFFLERETEESSLFPHELPDSVAASSSEQSPEGIFTTTEETNTSGSKMPCPRDDLLQSTANTMSNKNSTKPRSDKSTISRERLGQKSKESNKTKPVAEPIIVVAKQTFFKESTEPCRGTLLQSTTDTASIKNSLRTTTNQRTVANSSTDISTQLNDKSQATTEVKSTGHIVNTICKPTATVKPNNSSPTSLSENNAETLVQSEHPPNDQHSNNSVDDQNMSGFSDIIPFDANYSFEFNIASEVILEDSTVPTLPDLNPIIGAGDQTCLEVDPPADRSTSFTDSESDSSESGDTSEHEETSTEIETKNPAVKQTTRKPRRPETEACLICNKSVKKMRDHLTNSHRLNNNPKIKRFINTYYSTLATRKCYQCLVCLKRMGFKHTHPKHHKLSRIFDRENKKLFPVEVQISLRSFAEMQATPYQEFVEQFDQHLKGLADDGDTVSVNTMSSTLKKFLGDVIVKTKEFSETVELANCIRDFMEAHSLKKITMNNYMGKLKKFFTFLELHSGDRFPHFKFHPWDKILDEVRVRYHVGASRERRLKTKELHEKVPSLMQVQEMNIRVQEFLNKDLSERILNYRELCTLNFLILSFRLNCRAGPLLNLTWEDIETIKKVGSLDTDKHKTGRYYDVTIQIQPDQLKWLKRLKARFVKEFKVAPTLVFASSANKVVLAIFSSKLQFV